MAADKVLELYEKSLRGKKVEEKDFDISILPSKLKELIGKYNISYPSDEAVPQDMEMAHRIFDAAIELLLDVGIYCQDTRKIIGVERKAIEQALDTANSSHSIGQQEDEVLVDHRGLDDNRKPAIIGGACGASMSEENFLNIMMSYAKEDIDGVHTGSLQSICGKNIKISSPVEIMASRREALWAREAVKNVGKPGLALLGVMSGITSESQSAADFDSGMRPSDIHLLSFPNDLKVNWGLLKNILHNHNRGNITYGCSVLMLGGYSGGPEGTAITAVADAIQGILFGESDLLVTETIPLGAKAMDIRQIWGSCIVPLAFLSAGFKIPFGTYAGSFAGPCTEMLCDEFAADGIAFTASGFAAVFGGSANLGGEKEHTTGMESRIIKEICDMSAGMGLKEANEQTKSILAEIKKNSDSGQSVPKGKSYSECYDKNIRPSDEYTSLWEDKKRNLKNFGL